MNPMSATRFAPSFGLLRAHFAAGTVGLCAFSAALVWQARWIQGQFFQPTLLALVHLCVLGWFLPITLGALLQLVPVVFEVKLRSERAALFGFVSLVAGVPLLVWKLWCFDDGVGIALAGTLTAAGIVIHAVNLGVTIAETKTSTLTGAHVVAALIYLVLAALLGVVLSFNLALHFVPLEHLHLLRVHAHVAGLGFFGLLVMGVAYRLIEMFLLVQGAPRYWGWVSLCAINVGLSVLGAAFLVPKRQDLMSIGSGAAAIGILAFFLQVHTLIRRRMRKKLDVAWQHSLVAFAYLAAALGIGLLLRGSSEQGLFHSRLVLAYGLLALLGFLGTIVVSQLYKIVPFLVWLHRFSELVGLRKVPAASELLGERDKQLQCAFMHAGVVALVSGVLFASAALRVIGAASFALSAMLVARNLLTIDSRRP